jgi:hypothetical protein
MRLFILDFAMLALVFTAFAYRVSMKGVDAHEWVGVSVITLFTFHIIIHRRFYKNIFKGSYNLRRIIMTSVNILLLAGIVTLAVSGLMQSRKVLGFLHLPGGISLRKIHTAAAYGSFLLISVHIGIHWQRILNAVRKVISKKPGVSSPLSTTLSRAAAFGFAAFGVWSSFYRNIFSKLFLGFSFDYWDMERPALFFFAVMLSIMAAYILLTHYVFKLSQKN